MIPAVTTPMADDLKVDLDGLSANLDRLHESGIRGFLMTGTMGESDALDRGERAAVVRQTVETVGEDSQVIVGVSAATAAQAVAYAADAADAGAVAVMSLSPVTYHADDAELEVYFREIAAVGLPVVLYNNPAASRHDLPPKAIANLVEIDNVVAVKECSEDARRIAAILELTGGSVEVLVGGDDWPLEGIAAGAVGWMSGCANVAPREAMALVAAVQSGDMIRARRVNEALLPLSRFDMEPKLVQYYKYGLDLVGARGGPSRPPRLGLNEVEKANVRDALDTLKAKLQLADGRVDV